MDGYYLHEYMDGCYLHEYMDGCYLHGYVDAWRVLQAARDHCCRTIQTAHYGLQSIAISKNWQVTEGAPMALRVMQSLDHIVGVLCTYIIDCAHCDTVHGTSVGSGADPAVRASLIEINNNLRAIQESINRIIDGEAGAGDYTDTLKLE